MVQELKKEQYRYIAEIGGYLNLKESDDVNNDLNRAIIKAFKEKNGTAFLGYVNLPDHIYKDLNEGKDVCIYEEYSDQMIYNFGCDFVVPEADRKLESLLIEWNTKEGYANGAELLELIFKRIDNLGGLRFIWS